MESPTRIIEKFWPDGAPKNFINGDWADPSGRTASFDPSTGEVLSHVPDSVTSDVAQAVAAAQEALLSWRTLTMSQRGAYLAEVRTALEERGEDIALLESMDSGNPMSATRRDVNLALKYLAEWPGQALSVTGRLTHPHDDGMSLVSYEPYGVVGKIIAYNHPMLFALAGSIFPLMAGNTMVIKTAAQTPLGTLALGALLKDRLPPGVVNIVGGGTEAGDALVTHPDIKRIAFTGSDRTALAIQSRLSASGIVKHFTAELGGKNAFIIFEDADVEEATAAAFAGLSLHVSAGQSCQATAKILVHESIVDEVSAALTKKMQSVRVGVAYDESNEMGPLVSDTHLKHVMGHISDAAEEGAELLTGGQVIDRPGFFMEPTLFTAVTPDMRIAREEIFGPVATIMPFATEQEALAIANDTPYGLSAAVWTGNLDRALRVTNELQAGYIWVNDANRHYPGSPFGGMGASGVGREESVEEFMSFVEPKSVNIKVRKR